MLLTILAIYILIGCIMLLIFAKFNPDIYVIFNEYNNVAWVIGCCLGAILSIMLWPVIIVKGIISAFTD